MTHQFSQSIVIRMTAPRSRIPGNPKEREYQIIGVLADHEIGQPSDIATAVVPG